MILVSGVRFVSEGAVWVRQSARLRLRRSRDVKSLRQAAEIARLNSELHSAATGSDMQWRVMEVAEAVDESLDCRSFYLVDPYGQALPDFRPGQYLMVRPALAGAYQVTRCYSLSSSPDPRYYRITVKRQEVAGGKRPAQPQRGGLSAWLHETIHPGDCVLVGGPNGHFYLPQDSTGPLVLLAAGIGITPMASMLRWSLENTPDREVSLFYQVKDTDHWPLGDTLHQWAAQFPNITVHTFFSRADSSQLASLAQSGQGPFSSGKFTSAEVRAAHLAEQANFYMCGPDAWMQDIRDGLVESGIDASHVHWESFGSAVGAQPTVAGNAEAVAVRFEHTDVDTQWSNPEQSLWELARENQVEIPSGCLSGVCGCCRVKLLKGSVEYDRTISLELGADECLTCVARPTTDVVIDA